MHWRSPRSRPPHSPRQPSPSQRVRRRERAARSKPWVSQTVFDLKLDAIRSPVLVVGHAADLCARTPPDLMRDITAKTRGSRQQVVLVKGGPGLPAGTQAGLDVCEGRTPHGFVEQEAEVVAGIARFIRGDSY